jgi:MFS transporter, DHA1 family, inner membrane transport protein
MAHRASGTVASSRMREVLSRPALVLFLCLFATQATLLVLSPILAAVASDLGVTTATAGQLRTISGAVGGTTALLLGVLVRGRHLRDILAAGLALLAASSLISAAAPTYAVLAAAQVPIGVGLALVLAAGLAAAGTWEPERRSATLSWALVGQPVAWVVGMPLVGWVAEWSWRASWVALPFTASAVALTVVMLRERGQTDGEACAVVTTVLRRRGVAGWALSETLAYSAWAGTLIYAGALFVESYGSSTSAVGVLLAVVALAYLPGNFLARRWVDTRARRLLWSLPMAMAVGAILLGMVRPGIVVSTVLLSMMAFLAGARTIAGGALGLDLVPEDRMGTMSVRTAASQIGYLVGGAAGGVALGLGGYPALGSAFGALFVLASAPHLFATQTHVRPAPSVRV